ncbi:MAG: UPF0149 family protein [Rhodoferax sp.]|nr:UPF0149 family protein [Rhodoferax sp.]
MKLIHSPLTQTYSADGHTLRIQIYRSQGSPWILEIEDERGAFTVWDDPFDSDKAALEAAFLAIEEKGIQRFVTSVRQAAPKAEPEQLRKLAQATPAPPPSSVHNMVAPLSDEELDELNQLLLDMETEEGMTLDILDGYLHAIAMAPETVPSNQWLPKVWGLEDGAMLPPAEDANQFHHMLVLIVRHYNGILWGLDQRPPLLAPLWGTVEFPSAGEMEDAEIWAYGFTEGVKLSQAAWQPLFDSPQGQRYYRPIGLLGAENFSPDQDALIRTPEQRQALTQEIEDSLLQIHAFWLPRRQAAAQRQPGQRISDKVGRNEPCPCGSGKKFKKCCGAPPELR